MSKIMFFSTVALLLLPCTNGQEENKKNWYTRYPRYPEYCSTPNQMLKRSIPPLMEDEYGETRLVHASVIIRHGARTPWGNEAKCWKGYWDNEETAVWNCRLTQFVAPPSDLIVEEEEEKAPEEKGASDAVFLFEKQYNAFLNHPDNDHGGTAHDEGLSNKLNGTCQVGQLLLQGYEQQLQNGKILKDAYCFEGSEDYDHNVRMRLLDLTSEPWKAPSLTYRSDDDERTVMSGQVLLRGMFEDEFARYSKEHKFHPVISMHTADRERDILSANAKVCPRLKDLWQEALDSNEFQKFNKSKSSKHIRVYQKHKLGQVMDKDPVDCLMTTICTDRLLPGPIDDYHGGSGNQRRLQNCDENYNCTAPTVIPKENTPETSGGTSDDDDDDDDSWFYRILEYSIKQFIFGFLYNNAAYSRLGISPLWREIMANISPILHPDYKAPSMPKLALFSGHDTTIVPLMATLGNRLWNDTDWPPYASMMIIEIHEIIDGLTDRTIFESDFAFRLLYNGRVMTGLVDGCRPDLDLCDAKVLEDKVLPMAMEPWQCHSDTTEKVSALAETQLLLSTPGGIAFLLFIICFSAVLGGVGVFVYLTRRLPFSDRQILAPRFSYEQGISLTEQDLGQSAMEVTSSFYGSADTSPSAENGKSKDAVTLIT